MEKSHKKKGKLRHATQWKKKIKLHLIYSFSSSNKTHTKKKRKNSYLLYFFASISPQYKQTLNLETWSSSQKKKKHKKHLHIQHLNLNEKFQILMINPRWAQILNKFTSEQHDFGSNMQANIDQINDNMDEKNPKLRKKGKEKSVPWNPKLRQHRHRHKPLFFLCQKSPVCYICKETPRVFVNKF